MLGFVYLAQKQSETQRVEASVPGGAVVPAGKLKVGRVEFDLLFKECTILQLIPGINNAKIAAGHVLCAVNGMLGLERSSQWLNSSGIFPQLTSCLRF